ncbi:hypothetical protein [Dysgonomonas macrotermitis]|uniref:C1q domain-containing protein n=1 Tax=Dysgonomonas macrotermitis TaxID=1346286 RepID=A0A1M5GXH0_9BACT|nr:hypothetical protein [Dysgonomonas macrotermitis]SHG08378.1 hypothetical protein SAMN05444362_11513 [Dysgonomonas macrotermitis]
MKKKILLLMGVFTFGILNAQVGINTQNPQATLAIVSEGNTSTSQALAVENVSGTEILSLRDHGHMGLGVNNPMVRLDLRDGVNNSIMGIGNSSQTATAAKAGALKYDSGPQALYLSDGTNWNKLSANVIRTYVVADIINISQSFATNTSTTVMNWRELEDLLGTFSPTTGIFTAPRTGTYTISAIVTFDAGLVGANSYMQMELISPSATVKCQTTYYGAATFQTSVLCSGNFQLSAGETLKSAIYHNMGTAKSPKAGYCNLSILEN